MATLKTLVVSLNNDLHSMIGSTVGSALDACTAARQHIMSGSFKEKLDEDGLSDLIVFLDGIENLRYIFLRTSETESKQIIKINVGIDYFNDSSTEDGGILSRLECELVGVGEEMKDASLADLVATVRLGAVRKEKAEAQKTLEYHQSEITKITEQLQSLDAEEASLLASLSAKK